jgi:hypothetical protein
MTVGPFSVPDGGFGAPRLMSTTNRIRVLIGLCVLGSSGWAAMHDRARADEPRDANSPAAAASTPPERYLMLANGKLIAGVVTEDGKEFHVRQRIGVMNFRRHLVAGTFDTVRAAYDYQVKQLPDSDCEERMKLARWCLNVKLYAEAQEQLQKVLELNSKHPQARAMLFTMEQAAALAAQRQRDPDVHQTGAEEPAANNPGALDSAVIQKASRGLKIMGMPVIFDLPAPMAIKRTQEFISYVNPLLQAHCVKCHDGSYEGKFQLVSTKTRTENTEDALRLNLDATLALIDQDNLAKSELLTATLRPHGNGTRKRPIFPGSNDRAYQVLSKWAQSLRSPKVDRDLARSRQMGPQGMPGEAFAVGRGRVSNENEDDAMPSPSGAGRSPSTEGPAAAMDRPRIPRPASFGPAGAMKPDGSPQAAPDAFPLPFAVTGKKPNVALPNATTDSGKVPTPPVPGASSTGKPGSPADAGKPGNAAAAAKKEAKPVTIDPSLLERALQNRNGGH